MKKTSLALLMACVGCLSFTGCYTINTNVAYTTDYANLRVVESTFTNSYDRVETSISLDKEKSFETSTREEAVIQAVSEGYKTLVAESTENGSFLFFSLKKYILTFRK